MQLYVRLRTPTAESAFFLADVRTRLEAVIKRAGEHIVWSQADSTDEFTAALSPGAAAAIIEEAGTHRAQFVPSNSEDGAILTTFVDVHITGVKTDRNVVRTYNYPLRRSKSFRSGQVQSLDDALHVTSPQKTTAV